MAFDPLPPVPDAMLSPEFFEQLQNTLRQMNIEKGLSPSGQKYKPLTPTPSSKGMRLNQMDYGTLLALLNKP